MSLLDILGLGSKKTTTTTSSVTNATSSQFGIADEGIFADGSQVSIDKSTTAIDARVASYDLSDKSMNSSITNTSISSIDDRVTEQAFGFGAEALRANGESLKKLSDTTNSIFSRSIDSLDGNYTASLNYAEHLYAKSLDNNAQTVGLAVAAVNSANASDGAQLLDGIQGIGKLIAVAIVAVAAIGVFRRG